MLIFVGKGESKKEGQHMRGMLVYLYSFIYMCVYIYTRVCVYSCACVYDTNMYMEMVTLLSICGSSAPSSRALLLRADSLHLRRRKSTSSGPAEFQREHGKPLEHDALSRRARCLSIVLSRHGNES